MVYVQDTKPSTTFGQDTKPALATGSTLFAGSPIGLLLALTYATTIYPPGEIYAQDSYNSTSYSNDLKP